MSKEVILRRILSKQLSLVKGDALVVLFEESTFDLALLFQKNASDLDIGSTLVCVPFQQQSAFDDTDSLDVTLKAAIVNATAVITCLNDTSECTAFRSAIVDQISAGLAIAHTPGINSAMLEKYFDFDLEEIQGFCTFLALPLTLGSTIEIETQSSDGKKHVLVADIGGWERLPIISDGVIIQNSWGNLFAGETYIAPIEASAKGSIVINGALEGKILSDSELVLFFDNGRLVDQWSPNPDVVKFFLANTRDIAIRKADTWHDWNVLAEIGIGTNRALKELTGIPVIDEKMYGTIHIAIGDNSHMGGSNNSSIHFDMTTMKPIVRVNHLGTEQLETLISNGDIVFSRNWQQSLDHIELPLDWVQKANRIRSSGAKVQNNNTYLDKVVTTPVAKPMTVRLGDEQLSRLARQLYELVGKAASVRIKWNYLAAQMGISVEETQKVLKFLQDHRLVNVT